MARSVNVVALTGNLTRDPELRATPSGTSVCSLRLAVNTAEKRDGEWREVPNYFDITVWGKQADACGQYLAKGRPVAVQGRLRWSEWEVPNSDGAKRQKVEIVADTVQFLGSREGGGDDGGYGGVAPVAGTSAAQSFEQPVAAEDDIPF